MIYDSLVQRSHFQETVGNDYDDENQSSRGVLNDLQSGKFVTTVEEIAELLVASIQPCRNIPDTGASPNHLTQLLFNPRRRTHATASTDGI